jgi:hypothetical protein
VLISLDPAAADVRWEYSLDGEGPGGLGADEMFVGLPLPEAGVVLFR